MKCFIIFAIILLSLVASYSCQSSSEISLDAFSLISSQLVFLEDVCFNRTENETHYEQIVESLFECQTEFLNGTSLKLSFKDLVSADPEDFHDFYAA
jgi:hypothetical protein